MNNIINVLIIATAENRRSKDQDDDEKIPDLLDEDGFIDNDYSSELDNNKETYINIISSLYFYNYIIKYMTICPSYYSDIKVNMYDDPNYLGHIDKMLVDINVDAYEESFDCIFVTSAYSDMYNLENISTINKILKPNGILITTHPNGIYDLLSSNYKHYKTNKNNKIGNFNIFIKP